MPLRVIVSGGRNYPDRNRVFRELDGLAEIHGWLTIIEGGATGADTFAREWAQENFHGVVTVKADWPRYKEMAGAIRNEAMIIRGRPDMLLTFPGGRGTKDMRERANNHRLPIKYGG